MLPRAVLDAVEKQESVSLAENQTPTFQPVVRRYLNYYDMNLCNLCLDIFVKKKKRSYPCNRPWRLIEL
jgi:hypothetical protein